MTDTDLFLSEEPDDAFFDPFRCPKTAKAHALAEEVAQGLIDHEKRHNLRERARRANDALNFQQVIAVLVANLAHRALTVPGGWLSVAFSHRFLGKPKRYDSPVLFNTLPDIIPRLAGQALNLVEYHLGGVDPVSGKNQRTTLRAAPALLAKFDAAQINLRDFGLDKPQETIILKRVKDGPFDQGAYMYYEDTPVTHQYREEMTRINEYLGKADLDVHSGADTERGPDTNDRLLRRYFNNGSFEQGGRLFGGFWMNMNKERRTTDLVVDGEDVVMLDYAQMRPRILYAAAKKEMTCEDAYQVTGLEGCREGVKQVFNAMMMSDKPLTKIPQESRIHFPKRLRFAEVADLISTMHSAIADQLGRGRGLQMLTESQILVDVLLALNDEDITALPVHDAIIVPCSHQATAYKVMLDVFETHVGVAGKVQVTG